MAVGRRTLALCAVAVIGLIGAGSASAASPQRIYEDLADNGRLDGRYDRADIARALDLGHVIRTDALRSQRSERPAAPAARPASRPERSAAGLPFTGLDLALLTAAAGPLLLIAFILRHRLAGLESSRPEVIGS